MPASHVKAASKQPLPKTPVRTDYIFTLFLFSQQLKRSESLKTVSLLLLFLRPILHEGAMCFLTGGL